MQLLIKQRNKHLITYNKKRTHHESFFCCMYYLFLQRELTLKIDAQLLLAHTSLSFCDSTHRTHLVEPLLVLVT